MTNIITSQKFYNFNLIFKLLHMNKLNKDPESLMTQLLN